MVRIKHRYLLVNILYPTKPTTAEPLPDVVQFHAPTPDCFKRNELMHLIRSGVEDLFGDYGLAMIASSLRVIYLSNATSTAIVRISRDHYRLVWAALTFVSTLKLSKPSDTPCVIRVVRNSGTIRKAEEELIRRAKESVVRAQKASGSSSIGGNIGLDMFKEQGADSVGKGLGLNDSAEDDSMGDSDDND